MTKRVRVLSCLMLLALLLTGAGAREGDLASVPPALVTVGLLQARLSETESDPALDGETRGKLLALYRKALSNLEEVATHQTRADAFEEATRSAPGQTRRILERIHGAKAADGPEVISFSTDTPLDQIEQRLKREEADRAAADAQRAELDRQLAYQENRPAAIRQRLAAAQEEQDAIAAALQAELAGDMGSALVQARRWSQETRYIALSTETQALDQELLSLPMRLDLLAARRAEELTKNHRIEQRVEALQALVNARREVEANEAEAAALRMLQATAGLDPGLARLAEQNAALTAALGSLVAQGDRLDAEQQAADRLAARTKASFERAQTAKAVGVSTDGLGQLLLEQHVALPDPDAYGRMAGALAGRIAAVNLSRLRHLEEAERLADPAGTAGETGAPALPAAAAASRALWHDLMEQRRALLDRQLEAEGQYLERLRKLQTAEVQAPEAVRAYDDFLVEQLFWLPTGARTRLADLAKLPEELRLLLLPGPWLNLARTLGDQVAASPVLWLALLSSALLVWKRRRLIAAIKQTSVPLAKPGTDGFGHTLRALLLTLALAAPWPLLLGATGWLLLAAPQGTTLSLAFGASLVRIALVLYALLALRAICLPGGLAMAHFRWDEADVRRLRFELRWLTWSVVPTVLVLRIALSLNPVAAGGMITRLGLLVAALLMGLFFYHVFNPRHGLWRRQQQGSGTGLLYRAFPFWFPLLIAFPLVFLVLIWNGYVYTAHILSDAFVVTLGMITGLILLHAIGLRWLTSARHRLAFRAAREHRHVASTGRDPGMPPMTETSDLAASDYADLDLDAASEHSLELLGIAIASSALLGLYLIWSAVFPALGILDEVTLWYYTTTLDGDARQQPITLADLGLALVYLIATVVLARRLPALLNMVLAQSLQVGSASRYTITTLTTYAIIAIGTLLGFNAIGAQWSQLQWLVAALGVGIGFGLQEIVANFVSGLIILFERPVRVGDMVTVGDTDGVVTKIRIRATTIRNLDRKELLVPNKEFITGRLLNWSLSDKVTRVLITVGVDYGTDVERAHALMREAAEEHARVLDDPKPVLTFEGFGDNALTLVLRAFIDDLDYRIATITDLHMAINRKFRQAGIRIAFPQRDLHLDTREPLRVSLEAARPASEPESHPKRPTGGGPDLGSEEP